MTAAALLAALREKAGAEFACRMETTPWCSFGRHGERHVFDLRLADRASAARLLLGLNDHEFALPNDLVADVRAYAGTEDGNGVKLKVEALTFPID